MIPIRFMIPAPLARRIHLRDVVRNLMALFAVAGSIAVDSRSIRFQPAMAIVAPVLIRAYGTPKCENKAAAQCDS